MKFSQLGQRLAAGSGIELLMDDLGHALSGKGPAMHMLGGGNPAHIPEMEEVWARRMQELVNDAPSLRRTLAIYDPPRGNPRCIAALADLLNREFGWPVTAENIAVTPGGQTAFFFLFNLFSGPAEDGTLGKILFPITPEYIGYANQSLTEGGLVGRQPLIIKTGPHRFRYQIDFDALALGPDVRAMCISCPTNPSGNVLAPAEMRRLAEVASKHHIPLIIDNAYGAPFPGILFAESLPIWSPETIHVMSLSKLGLPGTRTAFVVGPPHVASAVSSMMAVTGLANGNFGQSIVCPLMESGEIVRLSREVVGPYYRAKRDKALAAIAEFFPEDRPYFLHEPDGAMFLWLWLPGARITSRELYDRLKARGVLVVPGEYFFFGLSEANTDHHRHECVRISFAMDEDDARAGIRIIGEEIAKAWD